MPTRDWTRVVEQGYNRIARDYTAWRAQDNDLFHPEIEDLANRLAPGASVLDVGCGAGVPFTQFLSERFHVTGVDLSPEQIRLAREAVPNGTFIVQDMLALDVPAQSFDAVTCMYSLIHVPRDRHPLALANVRRALKPEGFLLIVTGNNDLPESVETFFGAEMYWSHYDRETSLAMIREAGFRILWDKVISDRPSGSHVLALAQRA